MASPPVNPPGGAPPPALDPETTKKLAESIEKVRVGAKAAAESFQHQLNTVKELRDVMSQLANNMEKVGDPQAYNKMAEGWQKTTKQVIKTTEATKGTTVALKTVSDVLQSKFTKAATVAASALTGLQQGFKNLAALSKGAFGIFTGLVDGAFALGKAIISIPFKMMSGLFKMAVAGGGGNELAQAYENVREEFGSLHSASSKTIIDVAKGMGKWDSTGVSAWRVFGNLAQRMEEVLKLAKALGPTFQTFQNEIVQNGEAIMRYQRGLGMTDEQMQSLAYNAMRMGKGIAQVQNEMTKQALGMAKAFGLNAKVISKDMSKAMADLAHFGHLSTDQLAIAATFANKLGVSVDKLTGIMDATKTYDQAAEGMSKLNEAFGTNIDATELMMAQNPAEQIAILQKGFKGAGVEISNMNRFQRDLIKQNTGLDDSMLNAAFSAKGLGVNFNEISKQGAKNEKKVLSQADAMKELADSIKKLTPTGEAGSPSIIDRIVEGFARGVKMSPEFIQLMRNINRILRESYIFGIKLGRMFFTTFPGIKEIFGGLRDMFDPAKFRKMFAGVLSAMKEFQNGGINSLEKFMDKIGKTFTDFFDSEKPSGKKVIEGFKKFGLVIVGLIGKIAEWVVPKLAEAIQAVADWIKNPKIPDVGGATAGLRDALTKPFVNALAALKDKLWPAIVSLVTALYEKIKYALFHTKAGPALLAGALTVVLAPAIMNGVLGLVTSGIFSGAGSLIGKSLGSAMKAGIEKEGSGGVTQGITSALVKGAASASSGSDEVATATEMLSASIPDGKTIEKMQLASKSSIDWDSLGKFLLGMAGVIAVGLAAFLAALWIVKGNSIEDIAKAGFVFLTLVPMIVSFAILGEGMSRIKDVNLADMGKILLEMAGMIAIGLAGFFAAVLIIKKLNIS